MSILSRCLAVHGVMMTRNMVENRVLFSHENDHKALARDVLESTMPGMPVATMVLGIVRRAKSEYTVLQYGLTR